MMTRRSVIGILAAGALGLLSGCGFVSRRGSYRVRMTVEAETSAGPRSGSGVLQINASEAVGPLTAHEHAGGAGLQGEAVVLDLPDGPVFVLLIPDDPSSTLLPVRITEALDPGIATDASSFLAAVRSLGKGPGQVRAELPRRRDIGTVLRSQGASDSNWPMMVRFRDINDPQTVERVEPEAIGVRRILLETTRDPVTTGIGKRLRWLRTIDGSLTRRLSAPDPTHPPFRASR